VRSEQSSVWLGCGVRQDTTLNLSLALRRYRSLKTPRSNPTARKSSGFQNRDTNW
jgi:hypothetical protein